MSIANRKYESHPVQEMDDVTLWRLFRNGNTLVFEIIDSRYVNLLVNYGRRICNDDEILKDAIQDLFTDLWRNRENLGPTDSIQYYLVKAFRRNLIKKVKSARKYIYDKVDFPDFEFSPEMAIINLESDIEIKNQLYANLNALSSRQKEIIFLRFYCGMGYSTISKIMSINSQSAYNTVSRVLKILRERMLHRISLLLVILFHTLK
jgi:RNA polymerase sigma factor (sigma-70 family)